MKERAGRHLKDISQILFVQYIHTFPCSPTDLFRIVPLEDEEITVGPVQQATNPNSPWSPGDLIEFSPEPDTPTTANEQPKEATPSGTRDIQAALRELGIQVLNHPVLANPSRKRAAKGVESLSHARKKAKTRGDSDLSDEEIPRAGKSGRSPLVIEHQQSVL